MDNREGQLQKDGYLMAPRIHRPLRYLKHHPDSSILSPYVDDGEKRGEESMYILYPIYKEEHFISEKKTEDTYRFMLINKHRTTLHTDGDNELCVYLFPLYDHRRYKTGDDSATVLYPLLLNDDSFKRNYLPLFEVFYPALKFQRG